MDLLQDLDDNREVWSLLLESCKDVAGKAGFRVL